MVDKISRLVLSNSTLDGKRQGPLTFELQHNVVPRTLTVINASDSKFEITAEYVEEINDLISMLEDLKAVEKRKP